MKIEQKFKSFWSGTFDIYQAHSMSPVENTHPKKLEWFWAASPTQVNIGICQAWYKYYHWFLVPGAVYMQKMKITRPRYFKL